LTNTILLCEAAKTNVFGPLIDGGHNICSDGSASFTAPSSVNNTDPLLGPLGDNGGPTPTMALLPMSPVIDAGDDSVCPPTDQRGVPRPQGLACDIGAFELAPVLTVSLIRLNYTFQAATTNTISASTNLLAWTAIGTEVTDTNGTFQFTDPDSAHLRLRFYQVQKAQ
jgi:hypothetical protein